MQTEEEFFDKLSKETASVFKNSPVYKNNRDKNWWYSISNGQILKNKPIVFGLNWGVDKNHTHHPQKKQPSKTDDNNWPFKDELDHYLGKLFDTESNNLNYSNLCFFRTPKANYLSNEDWRMAIPLFQKYVEFINPPYLIMLGAPKYLNDSEYKQLKEFSHLAERAKRRAYLRIGKLFEKYKIVSVPHPQARVFRESRNYLWQKAKDSLND